MITLVLHVLRLFPFLCGGHRPLALENLALRQHPFRQGNGAARELDVPPRNPQTVE
jgi:hypothetical protein